MGTRSLTVFMDGAEEIVVMYRQFDGYLSGHGRELATFLDGMILVNGLSGGQSERVANGMGCLAAQVVANFKEKPGGIYLYPAKARDCGEDYTYIVSGKTGELAHIQVYSYEKLIVEGNPKDILEYKEPDDE